jgi:UDP-3-O-[3-hydroxymyristoyl] glucosamine N-acyltransferase
VAYRLAELAAVAGGRVEGDPDRAVESIQTLEAAGPGDLSFLNHARYRQQAEASSAGALLVTPALATLAGVARTGREGRDLLLVDDPALALARLLALFHPRPALPPGVHPTAVVEEGASVDPTAHVGPYAVIGPGSRIAAGAVVGAHAVLGRGCEVRERAFLHPHVVLYDDTFVGEGSEIHAGVVLGSDGFGYATHGGTHHKVPQVGRVVVEAEVEVGANTTIDRATLGETRVGAGTKIDNLVQVGHNVRIGRASILCGQAGIAGSTRLGDGVVLAGQAGVGGHLTLGDRVQVAAKSAALTSVEPGETVAGIPAIEMGRWRREVALRARLEKRLAEVNRRLDALERGTT